MSDQTPIEPMPVGRFLELLNKSPRNTDEEQELQQELLRQAQEKNATEASNPAESQAAVVEQPVEPTVSQDAPVAPSEPTPPAQESAAPSTGTDAEAEYSLSQLCGETNEAIAYLQTQNKTIAIEMAIAAYMQAAYWLKLAGE